jgi:hypothetical protein
VDHFQAIITFLEGRQQRSNLSPHEYTQLPVVIRSLYDYLHLLNSKVTGMSVVLMNVARIICFSLSLFCVLTIALVRLTAAHSNTNRNGYTETRD